MAITDRKRTPDNENTKHIFGPGRKARKQQYMEDGQKRMHERSLLDVTDVENSNNTKYPHLHTTDF